MDFDSSLQRTINVFQSLAEIRVEIAQAELMLLKALMANRKLLICGNGGSAAEAAHFATELVGRFARNRRPLPAIALSSDGSLLSCIGNDFGYAQTFSRQVLGLAQPGDVLVVLSSSGNSENLLMALEAARTVGIESVAFLGRGGGRARGLATCELIVPGDSGAAAQEAHLFLIHHFCTAIDQRFA